MKNVWIALAALIALIFVLMRTGSGYEPPKYISEAFIGLCPPGQMPASYTDAGGACVPYFFD
jgi:hypothetical protein